MFTTSKKVINFLAVVLFLNFCKIFPNLGLGFCFMNKENKRFLLDELYLKYSQIVAHPTFDLAKARIVRGVGNIDSKIVFLGEGPGAEEDRLGMPFVGQSGQLLTKLILSVGIRREDIYITNVIKCRLENNRPPTEEEIEYEKKAILDEELKIINPKLICCLGASATKALLGQRCRISSLRGSLVMTKNWQVLPLYHPAYLMRKRSEIETFLRDLKKLSNFLKDQEAFLQL